MGCKIENISYYLPKNILSNADCARQYEKFSEDKIARKVGIEQRHIASENEFTSDLAVAAAEKIFSSGACKREEIDFLILCTQNPDYKLPTTACLVQEELKLKKEIGAFDINLGCSGFVYALGVAKGMITAGMAKKVLLIMSETYSKLIHPKDYSVRTIFGDGAAAILVEESQEEQIGQFVFGTDGSGAKELIVPAGGCRLPISSETKQIMVDESGSRTKENLYMDGPNVFLFSVDIIEDMYHKLLKKYQYSLEDIDLIVPHQANKYILDYARKKLKIPTEKIYVNMKNVGNTVSASIPIALKMAEEEGRLKKGDKVMLLGFGVGYSWAGTIITY